MQRLLPSMAAGLVFSAAGLVGTGAGAQSIHWTGHYYIALAESANGSASVVGYPGAWNGVQPLRAFSAGEFIDFAVRPLVKGSEQDLVPDHRYDVLAVGMTRLGPVSVAGYENEGAPLFEPSAIPIPGIGTPLAVRASDAGYFVVASRPMDAPDVTGDYVVAYGTPQKWSVAPGPDFHGGLFVDMAVAPTTAATDRPTELLAIGISGRQAVLVQGYIADDRPVFEQSARLHVIPGIVRPVAIEWTGVYYVVIGLDAAGRTALVYGSPSAWSESKSLLSGEVDLTDLALRPMPAGDGKPSKAYDLVAVGNIKGMVVTVSGEEADSLPMLFPAWSPIPGFGGPAIAPWVPQAAALAGATVAVASPNPFSTRTELALSVGREQAVLVEVFDAIGRRVAMLHNGLLAAGVSHAFSFDGSTLPSGTYHFRINGVDFSEVRTVTLAR
jgi:hypothetical protein